MLLKVLNMDESRMQWEQEVYREIQFQQVNSKPKKFTFQVNDTMNMLSFADQKEANEFKYAIEERTKQLKLKTHIVTQLKDLEHLQPPPPQPSAPGKFQIMIGMYLKYLNK